MPGRIFPGGNAVDRVRPHPSLDLGGLSVNSLLGPVPAMSYQQLRELCEPVYGLRWVEKLAPDVGVNLRTVQRWAAGEVVMNARIATQIRNAVELRKGLDA